MVIGICILIIILSLLVVPIRIHVDGHLSAFDNGRIRIFLLGKIQIISVDASIKKIDAVHSDLLIKAKKKLHRYHINANKADKRSVIQFFRMDFKPIVDIVKLQFSVEVGKRDDAMFTVILLSAIKTVICAILSYIKTNKTITIDENFVPKYSQDSLQVDFYSIINISFADIIYGLIILVKNKIKNGGNKIANRQKRARYRKNDG